MVQIKSNQEARDKHKSTAEKLEKYFSVLSDQQIVELEYMLNTRKPVAEILQVVTKEWGYFSNIAPRTISDKINAYNVHIAKPKLVNSVKSVDVYREVMALTDKIDVIKELSILVHTQKARLERIIAIEGGNLMGLNAQTGSIVRREMKLFAEILEKLSTLQLETGALKRAPKVVTGEMAFNDKDLNSINFKITENFMETIDLISKQFIDVQEIPEGTPVAEQEAVHEPPKSST